MFLKVVSNVPGPVLHQVVDPVGPRPVAGASQGEHRSPRELTHVTCEDVVGDRPAVSVRVPVAALLQSHAEVRRVVVLQAGEDLLVDVDELGRLRGAVHHGPDLRVDQLLDSNPGYRVVVVYKYS